MKKNTWRKERLRFGDHHRRDDAVYRRLPSAVSSGKLAAEYPVASPSDVTIC
ncbi:MAG: hypothetical protein R2873_31225 [Caldilineaceae bacterium]